ncbi:16S rRNA (adenine(1518)-N(6)/adenine(1519)-N(6))-dimethyltransferase RsmA [Elioraea thermophila]|uniref:16S rRNA (adenine(1518)-N(6)/adenine(1519)-N(6))- dimethyltransferase RsmA n=1 Tax=Elioraea thermophila TaxID=2185104 RepID=UPI000DF25FBC|nr:16S rRNA (adenine(1518)-N(6)/adenine(1519)-N(6))-dimethyltransferase RsmA [Elioraea thermophila]
MSARRPLREVIAEHGLAARKSLGQHFLLDPNLLARIVREAGPLAGRHVIEIGPGPGGLTRALLDAGVASVTAIERDPRCVAALADLVAESGGRLRVIEADALTVPAASLVPPPRAIVANLPYNIATPLLVGWLREIAAYESLTLMFQAEVAERITASPGSPGYGRLAVLAQWVADARIVLRLPPRAFTPPPKVASAVVRLVPRQDQPRCDLFSAMERVTAAAFGQRRKMLRAALKSLGEAEALLAAAGIAADRRAETLSVAEFDRLARLMLARRPPAPPMR